MQDWRRNIKPQVSVMSEKGANVLSMAVVEDFIYLNTSASRSSLQVNSSMLLTYSMLDVKMRLMISL